MAPVDAPAVYAAAGESLKRQQRLIAVALAAVRRAWGLGAPERAARAVTAVQARAALEGARQVELALAAQGASVRPVGTVQPSAFSGVSADGRLTVARLIGLYDTLPALEQRVALEVSDAARAASGVAITARTGIGWVRMVNPPCCDRCAILAGKFYKWNDGFLRHPNCDCRHIPVTEDTADDLRTDPMALFDAGLIKGQSKADQQAVRDGADLGQVVNIRREAAGLSVGGRVVSRGGRLTPEGIYREADGDRARALALLRQNGYLR